MEILPYKQSLPKESLLQSTCFSHLGKVCPLALGKLHNYPLSTNKSQWKDWEDGCQ